jgi:hypothetical protein
MQLVMRIPGSTRATISGVVRSPDGEPVSVALRLHAASSLGVSVFELAPQTTSGLDGRFTFQGVPVGEYHIDVGLNERVRTTSMTTPGWWASEPVSLIEGTARGVVVQLHNGYTVSGRIDHWSPTPKGPVAEGVMELIAADPFNRFLSGVSTFRSGRFSAGPAAPGGYVLRATIERLGFIEEMTSGGRSVVDAPIVIDRADISDVVISVSSKPLPAVTLKLIGIPVDGCNGHNCRVAFFPVDERLRVTTGITSVNTTPFGTSPIPRHLRLERVLSDRIVTLDDVPAGEYYAAIIEPKYAEGWPSPATLKAIVPLATRVSVLEGQPTTVELRR